MEEDETSSRFAHCALPLSTSVSKPATLNTDEYNVRAEELAMHECQKGYVVERELTETEMVTTSCGSLIPGTPDGGFINSEGKLRLVQVVRVPLLPEMSADTVGDTLYETVLTKVVKSQMWMKEMCTFSYTRQRNGALKACIEAYGHELQEFIIFCWLPAVGAYRECLRQSDSLLWSEALIANVRSGGWPFALKMMVPAERDNLFPESFGLRNERRTKKNLFNDLCYFLNCTSFCEEDDEDTLMQWDLFGDELDEDVEVQDTASTEAAEVMYWISLAIQLIEDSVDAAEVELQAVFALIVSAEHASLRSYPTALNMFYWRSVQTSLANTTQNPRVSRRRFGLAKVRLDVGGLPWCIQRGWRALHREIGGPLITQGLPWWDSRRKRGTQARPPILVHISDLMGYNPCA